MPLDIHKDAPLAHMASMAAHEQGKFWEFHDKIFKNQTKIKREFLLQYARELGLDMKKFVPVPSPAAAPAAKAGG